MSNELVYGDASKFVTGLRDADASAREFFAEVVTYLSACVKNLSIYREGLTVDDKQGTAMWSAKIESTDDTLKISTSFSTLTMLCGHPPGTVRFLLAERVGTNSVFHPRGVEGHISFTAGHRQAKNPIENAAQGGKTENSSKNKPRP